MRVLRVLPRVVYHTLLYGSTKISHRHPSPIRAARALFTACLYRNTYLRNPLPTPPPSYPAPLSDRVPERTTLFAVMAADVIMLNLWAHDVGRADGQAYSVLRSVFEEAVRLYEGQGRGLGQGQDKDRLGGGDIDVDGVRRDGDGRGAAVAGGAARFPKASDFDTSTDVCFWCSRC